MATGKLHRSRTNRMLLGVCGGLGEYFGIDPTIVRIIFVVAALAGGPGLLAYLIFSVVVPSERALEGKDHRELPPSR